MSKILNYLNDFYHDSAASINVIAAISAVPLIGIIAFAVELGNYQASRLAATVVADSSALSAALTYSEGQDENAARQIAEDISNASGIELTDFQLAIIASPRDPNTEAVQVDITARQEFLLAKVVGASSGISANIRSIVEIGAGAPSCIIALSGEVTGTANASVVADGCGISAASDVRTSLNATIEALGIDSQGSVDGGFNNAITTSPNNGNIRQNLSTPITDPYAGNTDLDNEFNKIGNAERPQIASVFGGQDFIPPASILTNSFTFDGKIINKVGGVWRAPPGTYNIRDLVVSGNTLVRFQGNSDLFLSGDIRLSDNAELFIDSADITSTGALMAISNADFTIGDGRFMFKSIALNGNNVGSLGDGDLDVEEDIIITSNASLAIGRGDKIIGGDLRVGLNADVVSLGAGDLDIGGSLFVGENAQLIINTPPSFDPEIYINNDVIIGSNADVTFASSRYYIGGRFDAAGNADITGMDVNFFLTGLLQLSGNAGSTLSAPSSDGEADIESLLFATRASGNISISGNGILDLVGSVYTPNADINILDNAQISIAPNICFLLIAESISLNANAQLNSSCNTLSDDFITAKQAPLIVG